MKFHGPEVPIPSTPSSGQKVTVVHVRAGVYVTLMTITWRTWKSTLYRCSSLFYRPYASLSAEQIARDSKSTEKVHSAKSIETEAQGNNTNQRQLHSLSLLEAFTSSD